jgi:hypothetical protein
MRKSTMPRKWVRLTQIAVWIVGIASGFFLPPPTPYGSANFSYYKLALFLTAVIVGLLLIPMKNRSRRSHTKEWISLTIVMVLGVCGILYSYSTVRNSTTFRYEGNVYVKGQYTNGAQAYLAHYSGMTDSSLLLDAAGQSDLVWTPESVETNTLQLSGLYVAGVACLTICMLSLLQSLKCQHVNVSEEMLES